ncbi:beta-galactosidase trimerization domain-containing protein [Arthrobacter sp. NA-172]|uniref:beta-galactosidase n=1 Tax=Arthrobacter sp. NA-172 TaxID=3367524 RepID=UPI003755039A
MSPATSPWSSRWHAALTEAGLTVDFTRGDENLNSYSIVIVPSLFVTTDAQAQAIDDAVRAGSSVLVTDQTGIVDESLRVRLGGYLGELQSTLGVWIEEFRPLAGAWARPGAIPVSEEASIPPVVTLRGDVFTGGTATGTEWSETVHVREADIRAVFDGGPLGGWPALTRRAYGQGAAWYLATRPDAAGRAELVQTLIAESRLRVDTVIDGDADGFVETVRRGELLFVINHGRSTVSLAVQGRDVLTGQHAEGLTLAPNTVAVVSPTTQTTAQAATLPSGVKTEGVTASHVTSVG